MTGITTSVKSVGSKGLGFQVAVLGDGQTVMLENNFDIAQGDQVEIELKETPGPITYVPATLIGNITNLRTRKTTKPY